MKLENSVRIAAAPEEVFALINDVEQVVTCVPGAALTGRDGDVYRGGITVKVGPIRAAYSGTVEFQTVDVDSRRLTMSGRAADTNGGGDAQANIMLAVDPAPDGSLLRVDTDLVLSGKIVAFGKGAIVAVSNKIMAQFAANLAALLSEPSDGGAVAVTAAVGAPGFVGNGAPSVAKIATSAAAENASSGASLDVLSLVPPTVVRRAGYAAVFALGMVEGWLVSRAFRRE
ncbi:SRPBCC domain-containing protein [Nocardia sp. R7R-8]|uniref:SRPBCC domain-containing protein n=1 Tax=Nocardia sp. R7R-8 TaxID=3459304 RepID=UPI00403E23CC